MPTTFQLSSGFDPRQEGRPSERLRRGQETSFQSQITDFPRQVHRNNMRTNSPKSRESPFLHWINCADATSSLDQVLDLLPMAERGQVRSADSSEQCRIHALPCKRLERRPVQRSDSQSGGKRTVVVTEAQGVKKRTHSGFSRKSSATSVRGSDSPASLFCEQGCRSSRHLKLHWLLIMFATPGPFTYPSLLLPYLPKPF